MLQRNAKHNKKPILKLLTVTRGMNNTNTAEIIIALILQIHNIISDVQMCMEKTWAMPRNIPQEKTLQQPPHNNCINKHTIVSKPAAKRSKPTFFTILSPIISQYQRSAQYKRRASTERKIRCIINQLKLQKNKLIVLVTLK